MGCKGEGRTRLVQNKGFQTWLGDGTKGGVKSEVWRNQEVKRKKDKRNQHRWEEI